MSAQLQQSSSNVDLYVIPGAKKKRVRYKTPTYKKIYSAYIYDQDKYSAIFKRVQQLALKYSPEIFKKARAYKVLDLCYIRDEFGKLQPLGDEKHIFRYKTLHKVYEEIAQIALKGQLKLPLGDFRLFTDNLIIYFENQYGIYEMSYQAEIEGTQKLPVGERLRIHIRLLRLLRQGYKVKKAVKIAKR